MLDWFVVTTERIPGKSYRWYVNDKLYKQVLAPGLVPTEAEKAVTAVSRRRTTSRCMTSGGRFSSRPRTRDSPMT